MKVLLGAQGSGGVTIGDGGLGFRDQGAGFRVQGLAFWLFRTVGVWGV